MTREKAIECMDRLAQSGYRVCLYALPTPLGRLGLDDDNGVNYHLAITELSVDTTDVKALVQIADDLGLECGVNSITPGFVFTDPRPERHPAVHGPRNHPR